MNAFLPANLAVDLLKLPILVYVIAGALLVLLIAVLFLSGGYRSFRKREDKELYDVSSIKEKKLKPEQAGKNYIQALEPVADDDRLDISGVVNVIEYRPDPETVPEDGAIEERPVLEPDPEPEPIPEPTPEPVVKHVYEEPEVRNDVPDLTFVFSPELKLTMQDEPKITYEKPSRPTSYVFAEDSEAEEILSGEPNVPEINIVFEKETPARVKPI